MKFNIRHFLLISPFLVLSNSSFIGGIIPPEDLTFIFEPAYFGPYDGTEGETNISFSYKYTNNIPHTKVYELLVGLYDGRAFSTDYTDYHTLTKGGQYPSWHLCDLAFLRKCKPDAVIINAARGGVIDENAALLPENDGKTFIIDDRRSGWSDRFPGVSTT